MAPQTWNGPSTATPPDVWHVLIAPGETKILSLEQLDDFFRLEVIDASTKVWQPGMKEWMPLSVVAGLEDEPAPLPAPRKPPPPPSRAPSPAARPTPPPQRTAAPLPQVAAPWPAPAASAYPPAVSAYPPAVSAYPPAASAYPVAPITPYVAPVRNAPPVFAAPESTRPMVLGNSASMQPQGGSRAGSVLLGFAMLAAVGVTLYRNDMLRDLAKSAGQEAAYQQVERTLGSPGFGTPRAVAHLSPLTPSSAELSAPGPAVAAPASLAEPTATATAVTDSNPSASSKPSGEDRAAASSNSPKSLESLVAAQVDTAPAVKRPARSPQPAAPARQKRAEPSQQSLGLKGSTNRFDPLNDKL